MSFDVNDPKWTAYAFGELDGSERSAIEVELRHNPTAQRFVAELQKTGELLKSALAKESVERLTPEQQAALAASTSDQRLAVGGQPSAINSASPVSQTKWRRRRWVAVLGVLAASGLIVAILLPAIQSAREHGSRVVMNDKKKHSTTTAASPMLGAEDMAPGDPADKGASVAYSIAKPVYEGEANVDHAAAVRESLEIVDEIQRPPVNEPSLDYPSAETWQALRGKSESRAQQATPPRPADAFSGGLSESQIGLQTNLPLGNLRAIPLDAEEVVEELERVQNNQNPIQDPRFRKLRDRGDVRIENEAYALPPENAFEPVAAKPLSTFSIDVDTASYANIRRFLMQNNQLPPPAAVRIEELINYFRYDYPQPDGDVPFSVTTEVATAPWNSDHRLVRSGLKGKEIAKEKRPVSNLVFLLDVSGSMQDPNKLPLVRESMKMLVRELSENDRVAIVVYAGASGMVLDSTTGDQQDLIIAAIDRLQAGGSTNGAGGIQQAYDVAMQHFIKGGTNRVILATDGDFNVGITDRGDLVRLIEEKAKSGVFLTTVGYGMGNLKDATLEQLADKGNGNYAYVDTLAEARKVFVEEMSGTLVTIAKDVKVQIEFNPAEVASYRLIGYENRVLSAEDFNDDKKDAGEIGAGHTVTALYELVPVGKANGDSNPGLPPGAAPSGVDPLRYQKPAAAKVDLTDAANNGELFTLKLRYKEPDGDTSKLIEHPVKDSGKAYREASGDFKFAASVAAFGMKLRHSQYGGTITLDGIKELALEGRSFDPSGYRSEFLTLIEKAQALGAK